MGYDVAAEKQERKAEALKKMEAKKNAYTVVELAEEYFTKNILGRWKHPNIVRFRIEKDIKPNIGNDVLRWTKRMFDYAIKRAHHPVQPGFGIRLVRRGR